MLFNSEGLDLNRPISTALDHFWTSTIS